METEHAPEEAAPEPRPEVKCTQKVILRAKKKTCGSLTRSACGRCQNHCLGYAHVDGRRGPCLDHLT